MLERDVLDRDGQRQGGDALEQRAEDDLQLRPGELLAHALMPAVTERDVAVSARAVQVQPIRLGERARIPVGRGEVDDDALAGADDLTGDVDVFDGDAALAVLDDAEVAQQLLDGAGDESWGRRRRG